MPKLLELVGIAVRVGWLSSCVMRVGQAHCRAPLPAWLDRTSARYGLRSREAATSAYTSYPSFDDTDEETNIASWWATFATTLSLPLRCHSAATAVSSQRHTTARSKLSHARGAQNTLLHTFKTHRQRYPVPHSKTRPKTFLGSACERTTLQSRKQPFLLLICAPRPYHSRAG